MDNERQEKKEIVFETEDGVNIPVMFEALFIKYMGKILDYARMSDMSERALKQFLRSAKDDCYHQIDLAKAILKKHDIE